MSASTLNADPPQAIKMSCKYCEQYELERYPRKSKLRTLVMSKCECD
jgi:hypothetical protein